MKHTKRFSLFLAIGWLVAGSWAEAPADFALDKDKNGIKVYTRKIEGSSLKEFKGVTSIKTSLTSLVALMDDTDALTKWLHNCSAAKLVQSMNYYERITYTVINAPWPVSDRDTVSYSKIVQDPKSKVITIYLKGMADKYNDIAIAWPPRQAPVLISAYYAEAPIEQTARNAVLAEVGRIAGSIA